MSLEKVMVVNVGSHFSTSDANTGKLFINTGSRVLVVNSSCSGGELRIASAEEINRLLNSIHANEPIFVRCPTCQQDVNVKVDPSGFPNRI